MQEPNFSELKGIFVAVFLLLGTHSIQLILFWIHYITCPMFVNYAKSVYLGNYNLWVCCVVIIISLRTVFVFVRVLLCIVCMYCVYVFCVCILVSCSGKEEWLLPITKRVNHKSNQIISMDYFSNKCSKGCIGS